MVGTSGFEQGRNEGWQTLTLAYTTTHQEPQPYKEKKNKGLAGHGEE
jgi:hypothetical protein